MRLTPTKTLLGITATFAIAAAAIETLDVVKINGVLNQVAQEFAIENKKVSEFSFAFVDAETDVNMDKYKIKDSGKFAVPWQSDETSFQEEMSIAVELEKDDQPEMINGKEDFMIETDTVAMMNYYGMKITEYCKMNTYEQGRKALMMVQGCSLAKVWSHADSIEAIHKGMQEYLNNSVSQLRHLQMSGDIQTRLVANSTLSEDLALYNIETDRLIESFNSIQMNFENDQMTVMIPEMTFGKLMTIKDFELRLTNTVLEGHFGIVLKSPFGFYELAKAEILASLKDLEQNNETAKRHFKSGLHIMWGVFSKIAKL